MGVLGSGEWSIGQAGTGDAPAIRPGRGERLSGHQSCMYVYICTYVPGSDHDALRQAPVAGHRWSPTSQLRGRRELQCKLQCAATVVHNKVDLGSTLRIVLAETSLYASGPLNRGASDVARKHGIGGTTSVESLQQQLCRRARPFVRRDCFQSRASRPFPRIAA